MTEFDLSTREVVGKHFGQLTQSKVQNQQLKMK